MKFGKKAPVALIVSVCMIICCCISVMAGYRTIDTINSGRIRGEGSYSLSSSGASANASASWLSYPTSGNYSYDTYAEVSMSFPGGGYTYDDDENINGSSSVSLTGRGSTSQYAFIWVGATVGNSYYEVYSDIGGMVNP